MMGWMDAALGSKDEEEQRKTRTVENISPIIERNMSELANRSFGAHGLNRGFYSGRLGWYGKFVEPSCHRGMYRYYIVDLLFDERGSPAQIRIGSGGRIEVIDFEQMSEDRLKKAKIAYYKEGPEDVFPFLRPIASDCANLRVQWSFADKIDCSQSKPRS